ncbi:MAG: SulP family inorganic anion transporter [Gemmatimonadetes bacterium]|nr:SulP family inorganic anion transporter [Gemmatimonadota bacterium]MYB98959.1 SulP family inorganic anion transporter [Gemmatimonadota bacterium]MYI46377.1 SulP family inorganic anion transporter [Gemmatimonadota bacterium]
MKGIGGLARELTRDARSHKLFPALVMGSVAGVNRISVLFALGTALFVGALAPVAVKGVGLLIFGSLVGCGLTALFSGYRGATAKPPLASMAVFAGMAPTLSVASEPALVTMAAIFGLSAAATGIFFLAVGRLRATGLFRFVPYPVSGGFLTGAGGILCLLALPLIGIDPRTRPFLEMFEPSAIAVWAPGLAFAAGLFLASRRWGDRVVVPAGTVAAVALFHIVLLGVGTSPSEAGEAGLLLSVPTGGGGMWPPFELGAISGISWPSIAALVPELLVVVLLNVVSMVLILGGLELGSGREVDWDREFTVAGGAAVATSLSGAPASFINLGPTLQHQRVSADTRLTGLVTCAVLGLALVYGSTIIGWIPTPVMGAILLHTGIRILNDFGVRSARQLPGTELAIVLVIFFGVLFFGFLEAVVTGMLAVIVLFVFRLSRLNPIAERSTVRDQRSRRNRSIPDRAILQETGTRGRVCQLRGYVFFGSAFALFKDLTEDLVASRSVCIVLDIREVTGFDFSAVRALCGFLGKAQAAGWLVVLVGAGDRLENQVSKNLPDEVRRWLILEQDLDRAVERCEDVVIERYREDTDASAHRGALLERVAEGLDRQLNRQADFEDMLEELQEWIEPYGYAKGETLSSPDEPATGLQLMVGGQASAFDASGARVRQCGPGDAVDPAALYGRRKSDMTVVADRSCWVATLTPIAFRLLEESELELSYRLHKYLVLSGARR